MGWSARATAFPVLATVLALSWELAFGLWFPPERRASRITYRIWLLLDLVLFAEALAWGYQAVSQPPWFAPALVGGLLVALGGQVIVHRRLLQPGLQAYVVNLAMSLSFLHFYFARPEGLGLSIPVALLKLLGTACISLANVASFRPRWSSRPGLLLMLAAVSLLDVAYLLLLLAAR